LNRKKIRNKKRRKERTEKLLGASPSTIRKRKKNEKRRS